MPKLVMTNRVSGSSWWGSARLGTLIVANCVAVSVLLATSTPVEWSLTLLVWLNAVMFALREASRRAYLLGFLGAFMLFLLGRVTLDVSFQYSGVVWGEGVLRHLSLVFGTSLVVILCTYAAISRMAERNRSRMILNGAGENPRRWGGFADEGRRQSVETGAGILFWCTLPFSLVQLVTRLTTVGLGGYTDLYSSSFRDSSSSGLMGWVGQCVLINGVALMIYLATMPRRRSAIPVVAAWLFIAAGGLLTGERGGFVGSLLFLICYALARGRITPEDKWLSRRGILVMVLCIPGFALLLMSVEVYRGITNGAESGGGGVFRAVPDLLYSQGASANAVANAFTYALRIPDQAYLLEFLHYGIPGRLLGFPSVLGNSVDQALHGGSFTHSLAYVILGENGYLGGRGTGSSYVAEAFFSFGLVGVVLVSVAYGVLLVFLDRLGSVSVAWNAVRLIIVRDVFWAPRGSATGFLSELGAPSTWIAVVCVAFFAAWSRKVMAHGKSKAAGRMGSASRRSSVIGSV